MGLPPLLTRGTRRALMAAIVAVVVALTTFGAPASAATPDPSDREALVQHPGVRGSIVRLYQASFNRAADPAGLDYWVRLYVGGVPLGFIAQEFMVSAEWQSTYGELNNEQFVELIYHNVLDRASDPEGFAHWVGVLNQGVGRKEILLGFSESQELIEKTNTAPPYHPPPPPPVFPALPPNSGTGRRIVYSNSGQRVWLVEANGTIHNSYLVSGRRDTPRPGTYSVFSKSVNAWAGYNGITMKHMVRFTHGRSLAIGFHSIPRDAYGRPLQTEAQLGTYRSSGCIRQRDDLAEALYHWAPVGTTVVVTP